MEDGRGQQISDLNLLHLNLPPDSSSAAASVQMRSGCDSEAFLCSLGLLNHPAPVMMSNCLNSSLYNMGGAAVEMGPSSHVEPAHSLLVNSNLQIQHGMMQQGGGAGGKRSRRKSTSREGCKNNGEVIHVRAKRGQATDSHSLAERVRREKINDKLKALQHLVPGCYKTMGMAVMLDVIITYVQSLQNQIEFLSMKLSAASMFYDFNSPEAQALDAFQRTSCNPCEEEEEEEARDEMQRMERMMMMRNQEEHEEEVERFDPLQLASSSANHLHPTCPPFYLPT